MTNFLISTCLFLLAAQPAMVPQGKLTQQEAFFLRRITEFWKDRDYTLVKKQIEEFLAKNQQSTIHDNLHAILADILYQERDYPKALVFYEKINDAGLQQKTLLRKAQCIYLLGNYEAVIELLTPIMSGNVESELEFLLADSVFRKLQKVADVTEQKELAAQSKPLLLKLYDTNYKDKALLPLAEVHRILEESAEAATLYLVLAETMPDKKEEILLQAASLQMGYSKNDAIATFQKVVDLGQAKAAEAAYNELLLLFQENRFADLVSRAAVLAPHMADDKNILFNFCLGRSHFKVDQFSDAIVYFERYLQQEKEATAYKRAAFLTLISCSQKVGDPLLFDRVLEQFLAAFPGDEEAGKALLLHAQTALQSGNADQATTDLGRLLISFPNLPEKESLLYDHALLLLKTQKWQQSRTAFHSFIYQFPETPHADLIWSSIVHCSVQELKAATADTVLTKKGQLASDLQQALAKSNLFSPEEQANYRFLIGQLHFDLQNYSEALIQLTAFSTDFPDHPSIPQAFLLQARLHHELKSAPEVFVAIAEKALEMTKDQENKTALRLQLFNGYLSLKEYDQAAHHLYHVHLVDDIAIQQENQLWLAHYYYDRAKKGSSDDLKRVAAVYQKVLKMDENFTVHFNPEQTYFENEVLRFAELLNEQDKKKLLTSLRQMQSQNKTLGWKLERHILHELGKLYLSLNEHDEALKVFDELIASAETGSSDISNSALLEKSRILISRCPECDRTESNPTISQVLSTLKDLQIQKQLAYEPLHLEAALEYADIRTKMAAPETRSESAIFFLNRIKDDFNAKDNALAQEYHEARIRFPEKDLIYQNYMKCIEAEILRLEAELAKEQNDLEKVSRSREVALALLHEVLQDIHITPYLKSRAEHNLKALSL